MNNKPPYDVEAARIPLTDADYARIAAVVPQGGFTPDPNQGEWAASCDGARRYPDETHDFTDEEWDAIYLEIYLEIPQDTDLSGWTETV